MAPQRWKVPISIVAVNCIDNTDWLDIVVDDLNRLSPHVLFFFYIIQFIRPIWIDIIINPHFCIKHTNKTPLLIYL